MQMSKSSMRKKIDDLQLLADQRKQVIDHLTQQLYNKTIQTECLLRDIRIATHEKFSAVCGN